MARKSAPLAAPTAASEEGDGGRDLIERVLAGDEDQGKDDGESPGAAREDERSEAGNDPAEEAKNVGIRALEEGELAALRRHGLTDDDIDGLPDSKLKALAAKLQENRVKQDRAFDELRAQIARAEAGAKEGEERRGKEVPGRDPEPIDLRVAADPVRKALGLDESEGKVLEDWGKSIATVTRRAVQAEFQRELASVREQVQVALTLSGSEVLRSIRDGLRAEWPQVADSAKWNRVQAKADALFKGGGYSGLGDLRSQLRQAVRDAAVIELGAAKRDEEAKAGPDSRDKARPTRPTRNGQQPGKTAKDRAYDEWSAEASKVLPKVRGFV